MTEEQIKQEADRYANQNCRSCNGAFVPCICHNLRKAVARGAEFVLSSLQSRIKELEQENSLMKEALQGTENTYFYEEIKKRDKEIERLKARIEALNKTDKP